MQNKPSVKDKIKRLTLKDDKGTRTYQIFQLSPLDAIPFELQVLKYIAAGFKDNAEGLQKAMSDVSDSADQDAKIAIEMLSTALANIEGVALFRLIKNTMYKSETYFNEEGKTTNLKILSDEEFNKVFESYPEDILKVAIFIIKANCRSFFSLKKFIPSAFSGAN